MLTNSYEGKAKKIGIDAKFNDLELKLLDEGVSIEVITGIRASFHGKDKQYWEFKQYWELLNNIYNQYHPNRHKKE